MTSPAFSYPMIGILSPEACEEPGETGIRHFADPKVLDVVWEGDLSARIGMLLVDVGGRAWRVTRVVKLGRALNPLARYWRVTHEVAEEPPMAFEALRNLLLETLNAQSSAYDGLDGVYLDAVRENLLEARNLRDIVRTKRELEVLNAPVRIFWGDAVTGDGRGSRLEFSLGIICLAALAPVVLGVGMLLAHWRLPLVLLAPFGIALALALAALVARRIHDAGLGALWAFVGFVAASLPSAVLDTLLSEDADRWIGQLWLVLLLGCAGLLAAWPSQPRPNRFGRFPANRAGRLAAAAATADDPAS